jgi:small neutral amino acid transporter SnatA (MarC family)
MTALKGWKTIIFGLIMVVAPAAFNYLGVIDWQSLGISPGTSAIIGGIIIALRAVTNTPPLKGTSP